MGWLIYGINWHAVTLGSNISARWLRSYFSILQLAHNLEGVAGFDSRASLVYWVGGNSHSHDVRPAWAFGCCAIVTLLAFRTHLLNDGYVLSHG